MAEPTGVSQEELEMAFSGPAISSNKVIALLTGASVRITFAEGFAPEMTAAFRCAVVMAPHDALALRNVLSHVLKDIEPQIQAAIAGAEAEAVAKGNA